MSHFLAKFAGAGAASRSPELAARSGRPEYRKPVVRARTPAAVRELGEKDVPGRTFLTEFTNEEFPRKRLAPDRVDVSGLSAAR
jgi:hypothetical protein